MSKFNMDRYNEIKALCDEHKITRKDRAAFEVASHLRWMRHQKKIECTDEEIIEVVNYERDRKTLTHGENYVEGDLLLPWQKRSSDE